MIAVATSDPCRLTAPCVACAGLFVIMKLCIGYKTILNTASSYSCMGGMDTIKNYKKPSFYFLFIKRSFNYFLGFIFGIAGCIADCECVISGEDVTHMLVHLIIQICAIICGLRSGNAMSCIQAFVAFQAVAEADNYFVHYQVPRRLKVDCYVRFVKYETENRKHVGKKECLDTIKAVALIVVSLMVVVSLLLFVSLKARVHDQKIDIPSNCTFITMHSMA